MKVYDLHCDSALTLDTRSSPVSKYNFSQNFPHFQFFAIFAEKVALEKMREFSFSLIDRLKETFDGVLVYDRDSFERSLSSPRSGLISLEGASFVDSVALLEKLYEIGVRSLCPAWNNVSRICATNRETGTVSDFGVTDFGKHILKSAFELGMIVDVSHISDNGFWDILSLSDAPVIASHSNSRAVCRNYRNLTDSQAKAIVERGGIIGLNIFPPFISETDSFSDIYRQVEHFISLGAEDSLAFGFDIDGTDGMFFPEIPKFTSIHDFIIGKLSERFSPALIEKFAFANAERFLSERTCYLS